MTDHEPVSKTRSRVVVFRVTQEEYKLLRATCVEKGGRSLSEFARSELLAFLKHTGSSDERIAQLERKLATLQYSVQHLVRLMEGAASRVNLTNGY
jgi:hypothetical protein